MANNDKHQNTRKSVLLPLSCVLGLGIACALSQPTTALAQNPGWVHKDNAWTYVKDDGSLATGWFKTPNGKWFYFNKDNYKMVTGKVTDDNKDYWLDESQGLVYDDWAKDASGNWLHTNEKGILVTGWYQTVYNGKYWYFNDDYKLATGKVSYKGYDYWLDASQGLVYDSWVQDASGNWLHTDKWGCLVKGWYQTANGKWWYFNDDYKLATGKVTDKGYDYWLDASQGLVYDGWAKDAQGNWLHTNEKGILVKGWYYTSNGKWFYFNDDYTMKVGELKENGKIYTFDVNQGWVATRAEAEPSKPEVKPNQTPSDTQSGWIKNADGSYSYKDNNKFVRGWFKTPNGKWFYFNKATSKAEFGIHKELEDRIIMQSDPELSPGSKEIDMYVYWIDPNQGLVYNSWVKDNKGNLLHTDDKGRLYSGEHKIDGKRCFFDENFIYQPNHKLSGFNNDLRVFWIHCKSLSNQDSVALKQGAFAFFKAQGATRALEVLTQSKLASYTRENGKIDKYGNNNSDATLVYNMAYAYSQLKRFNELRVKSGLPEFKVTYRLMADAMVFANYMTSFKQSDFKDGICTAPTYKALGNTGLHSNSVYCYMSGYYGLNPFVFGKNYGMNTEDWPQVVDPKYPYTGYAFADNYYKVSRDNGQVCIFNQAFDTSLEDGEQAMTLDEYWDKFTTWVDSVK